jgi:transcriptional regulator with XRE-family HTH domain
MKSLIITHTNMLSKNIRLLREKLGYTQEQVAQYLNVTHSAVSQYENDSRNVPVEAVGKLALLYHVNEADLYEENPKTMQLLSAFAFRAGDVCGDDLKVIAEFKKVVLNHYHLSVALSHDE